MERPSGTDEGGRKVADKLADGPCAAAFLALSDCAKSHGITKDHKAKMQSCPGETDDLIRCVKKYPLFFQEKQ